MSDNELDLQRQVRELTARCNELQGALREMETLHDELEQSSKQVESELEQTIQELEENSARQARDLHEAERELEQCARDRKEKHVALEQLRRVADEERERGVVARREASAQLEGLHDTVTRLTREHDTLRAQLVAVEQENERLEGRERSLADQVKRDREQCDKHVEEITYLHTERDELVDQLQRARDEVKDLKAELMARDRAAQNHVGGNHVQANHVGENQNRVEGNHAQANHAQPNHVEANHVEANHVEANGHVPSMKSPRDTPRSALSVQSVALVDEMLSLVHAMEERLHRASDVS